VYKPSCDPILKPIPRGSTPRRLGMWLVSVSHEGKKNPGICPPMYQSYFKIIFDSHMLSAYKTEVIGNIYDKLPIMTP
jgi:hypothetical protein